MDESADDQPDRCASQVADLHRTIEERLTGRAPDETWISRGR